MRRPASFPVLIKRYGGVRLYDTEAALYVSAEDLRASVAAGVPIIIRDATTGADITADVLATPRRPN